MRVRYWLVGLVLALLPASVQARSLSKAMRSAVRQVNAAQKRIADHVTVRIPVDTQYDDSAPSLASIEKLVKALPSRIVEVQPGDTISSVVVREYGFGPKNLPRSYQFLEARILALNELQKATALRPGPLRIPTLPKRALTDPSAVNPNNVVPKVILAAADTALNTISAFSMLDEERKGAARSTLDIVLSIEQVRQLDQAELDYSTLSGQIVLDMSEAPAEDAAPPLTADLKAVRTFATKPLMRQVPLFIVDSGWPDTTARDKTLDYMRDVINSRRRSVGLAEISLPAGPWSTTYEHCSTIRAALDDYAKAAFGVDPIFLPLSRGQHADDLIRQVVILADVEEQLPDNVQGIAAVKDLEALAIARVDAILERIPEAITSERVTVDQRLIDSYRIVLDLAAERSRSYSFWNFSWIVDGRTFRASSFGDKHSIVVCAAGNEGKNLEAEPVEFAARALTDGQYLTIANAYPDLGPRCNSSYLNLAGFATPDIVHAASYNGEVGTKCGTSFAAPRVAWMLALRESRRKTTPLSSASWVNGVRTAIVKSRKGAYGWLDTSLLFTTD